MTSPPSPPLATVAAVAQVPTNAAPLVLVVDDSDTVTDVLGRYLSRAGLRVETASDGQMALASAAATRPDLVLLDLMLPGLDGLEVCRRLRLGGPVPVIMLTALGSEQDRVLGLELGADDYIVKPFSPREVVLRVQSVLRRCREGPGAQQSTLRDGGLELDLGAREAALDGATLALTLREFDLLAFLLQHPNTALRRSDLLQRVWGWTFGDESTVTVHVRRLREKIELDPGNPCRVVTVWGVGYRYRPVGPGAGDVA